MKRYSVRIGQGIERTILTSNGLASLCMQPPRVLKYVTHAAITMHNTIGIRTVAQ
jgi:hypothetical protein